MFAQLCRIDTRASVRSSFVVELAVEVCAAYSGTSELELLSCPETVASTIASAGTSKKLPSDPSDG
jgi:hypothetical protein